MISETHVFSEKMNACNGRQGKVDTDRRHLHACSMTQKSGVTRKCVMTDGSRQEIGCGKE